MAKVGVPHDAQTLRLKRIEGQVRGVQKMIEDRRYCVDIITQLQSVSAAIARVQELVLKKHLEHCVVEAMRSGREEDKREKIEEIVTILKNFGR
ncbi:MAG TPA: metal-sensitive transcriptional regulator [Candidatus Tripitaka californicus]|uniref:metal-sensitive transcriptional regulator n=1 Tax=Candidatus Tripitaka californicus TaxID=3367616 RepID=UPI00402761B5